MDPVSWIGVALVAFGAFGLGAERLIDKTIEASDALQGGTPDERAASHRRLIESAVVVGGITMGILYLSKKVK